MTFITKINLTENRLFKQTINKWAKFQGLNEFSVPMAERVLGADIENATKTIVERDIFTPFKYFAETDQIEFEFPFKEMAQSSENIPDINFNDDLENVEVPPVFKGIDPYTIEGVQLFDRYQGYEYDLVIEQVTDTEYGFKGVFRTTELVFVDAPSLDYKGDNIVVKVNGYLQADKIYNKQVKEIIMFNDNKVIDGVMNSDSIFIGNGIIQIENIKIPTGAFYEFIFTTNSIFEIVDGEIINGKEQYFGNVKIIKVNNNEFLIY